MAVSISVQDRTSEFKSILVQAQRKQATSKIGAQRQSLLSDTQKKAANGDGRPRRSEFARKAAEIGRGIGGTMEKLEKLAQCMSLRNATPLIQDKIMTSLLFYSSKTKDSLRRPSCGNQRAHIHNKTRPLGP